MNRSLSGRIILSTCVSVALLVYLVRPGDALGLTPIEEMGPWADPYGPGSVAKMGPIADPLGLLPLRT